MSRRRWLRGLLLGLAAAFVLPNAASSQNVVLDGTLAPSNAGRVPLAPNGSPYSFVIDETLGVRAGPNLFHSFDRFSLARDETAHFTGTPGIENLIARVTGGERSLIEGVISADPNVATSGFYLMNPDGITFRGDPSEQLSHLALPGSFYASTADRLLFEDSLLGALSFEADALSGSDPVTLDTAPVGWGFDAGPSAAILVDNALPLAVADGNTLSLVAGDVLVTNTAKVEAFAGSIEVAAVGEQAVAVPLALADYEASGAGLGEIRFEDDALVLAGDGIAGNDQGRVVLRGGRLVIEDSLVQAGGNEGAGESALDVQVQGEIVLRDRGRIQLTRRDAVGPGDARIEADRIRVEGSGSWIFATAEGGDATTAAATVELVAREIDVDADGLLFTDASDGSPGANLDLRTEQLLVQNGGWIASRTQGAGQGGSITVRGLAAARAENAKIVAGGRITSETGGSGRGGDIVVRSQAIELSGAGSAILSESTATALDPGGDGPGDNDPSDNRSGGNLLLEGATLSMTDGAQVASVTLSDHAGGRVDVLVDDVTIVGGTTSGPETGLFATSGRDISDARGGDAGDLLIEGQRLDMRGARASVSTRTFGAGDAGRLVVKASESVRLEGDGVGAPVLVASAFGGDGGGVAEGEPSLVIETGRLELLAGAGLLSSALSSGRAGDISVKATDVVIRGTSGSRRSSILSEAAGDGSGAGDGGQVSLDLRGDLDLAEEGRISVITRGPGASGGIRIEADGEVRVASGAAITSDAEVGLASPRPEAAGDIEIVAGGGVLLAGGAVRATGFGAVNAGDITLDAGPALIMRGGEITTRADNASGGNIQIAATERVDLLDARIETSVLGDEQIVDAGNIVIDPQFVIVNGSEVLATARLGRGGNIVIVTDQLLRSADSRIDASSILGIDGEVVSTGPENQIANELDTLPTPVFDVSELLRAHCAARQGAGVSLVLAGRSGESSAARGDTSLPLPLDALPATPDAKADGTAASVAIDSGTDQPPILFLPCEPESESGDRAEGASS